MELESSSVHVKATNSANEFEVHDLMAPPSARKLDPVESDDRNTSHMAEGQREPSTIACESDDCEAARVQRERVVLVCDLNSTKAKFELMLQTLRSIFRLGNDATWVDMLERAEALAEGNDAQCNNSVPSGAASRYRVGDFELDEAEVEREHLEERLEAQILQVARLRELLHRQQRLLDMTAEQIAELHQQNKQQAEEIADLKTQEEETSARMSALQEESESLQQEVFLQRELAAQYEHQLKSEAHRHEELENNAASHIQDQAVQLETLNNELIERDRDVERYQSEAETCRSKMEALETYIGHQNEDIDRLRDSLQVYEEAERRKYSYQARTPPDNRRGSCDSSTVGSPEERASPSDGASSTQLSSLRGSQRATRNESSVTNGLGNKRVAQAIIDDSDRDAFLSQFPMSSRTERQMRNRMETDRRKNRAYAAGLNSARSDADSIASTATRSERDGLDQSAPMWKR